MIAARRLVARLDDLDLPVVVRPALVAAEAVSILVTWSLWQARSAPPLLPVFEGLPQVDLGVIMLVTAALILFKPEAGVIAHSAALAVAFLLDQTRIQPEFISITLMLWGTTRWPIARTVAVAHLVSLWFWAGLNKALSPDFIDGSASFLFSAFPVHPEFLLPYFGWTIVASEMGIGVLLLIPRLRRAGVVLAVGLHVMGLLALVSIRWNLAVWPWNVALALGAVAFFWKRRESQWSARAVAILAAFAVVPVGFYAGYVDAYVAHNLYTSNTASATICDADSVCSREPLQETWAALRVPLPPEPRLFRSYFSEVCVPGDKLLVFPRTTRITFGRDTTATSMSCPGRGEIE